MSILGRNFFVMALAMAGQSVTVMGFCGGGSVDSGDCLDPSLCCSEWGWCGTSSAHCDPATCWSGPGCPNVGGGGGGGGTCGGGSRGNGVCANGECCSEYGWCGTSDAHCSGDGGGGGGGGGQTLYSGSGSGTYYYDVTGRTCNGPSIPENQGYPKCTSHYETDWKTMQQYGTNNIVAIDRNLLNAPGGRESLCGKQIEIYKDGVEVPGGPFVVFDGCEACEGGGKIDFSLSVLDSIDNGNACFHGVVPGISWKVTDKQIIPFVP